MKKNALLPVLLVLSTACFAQKPKINWGEEFKFSKGSTDLEIMYADKDGMYLQEGHAALKSYFVVGATMRTSASLVKLDKNLSEVYRNDFNKELRGKEFEQFFILGDKMFLFSTEYVKREKTLNVYASEVNKNSGELMGDWKQATSFQKEEKKDDINFKLTYSADSTKMVVVSSIEGKGKNEYKIQEFDKNIKSINKPVIITNEFDPKTFQVEDVLYTNNKKIILVGRVYEFQEGKKKKEKFLEFVNYNIRMYDEGGKQLAEINTTVNGKWITSAKLIQEKDKDLVLAAFYNTNRKEKTIDGMLVQRIDPNTGKVIATSDKAINNSLLSNNADDTEEEVDETETKAERKERERLDKIKNEGDAFSRYMKFRNIFYTADNSLVILAEEFHHYFYTVQNFSPGVNGMPGHSTSTTYSVDECGDLLACKIDRDGNISWFSVFPKLQREVTANAYNAGLFMHTSFFDNTSRPFYAGFGAIQTKNSIQVLFNDNPKNAMVTQPGQKVKITRRFGKSHCFLLTIDETTGKYNRKMFFSNADVPTAMPRLGSVVADNMYIVGKEDRVLGKSKISVAKISMN